MQFVIKIVLNVSKYFMFIIIALFEIRLICVSEQSNINEPLAFPLKIQTLDLKPRGSNRHF